MNTFPPAIFLMGPTAVGKTALALASVEDLNAEIISVDSAMVYRGMNIGTGKPEPEILQKTPHHLIDIREVDQPYSAADFREDALHCMQEITARGKMPLLVGGTFLYFKALQQGLSALPSADRNIRTALLKEAEMIGWPGMYAELQKIDPQSAARIHPNDPQRIQRALEVFKITGLPMSEFLEKEKTPSLPYNIKSFALLPSDRSNLHERIAHRFDEMLQAGLVEEVRELYKNYPNNLELPAFRSVGYRQILFYLLGKVSYEEMREKAIAATRQLAKRQLTWLRSLKNLHIFYDNTSQTMLQSAFTEGGEWIANPQ